MTQNYDNPQYTSAGVNTFTERKTNNTKHTKENNANIVTVTERGITNQMYRIFFATPKQTETKRQITPIMPKNHARLPSWPGTFTFIPKRPQIKLS